MKIKKDSRIDIRLPCYIFLDFKRLCELENKKMSDYIRDLISLEIIKHGKN